ncbi:YqkE family protein [Paenibacillus sp. strain BS8-2]
MGKKNKGQPPKKQGNRSSETSDQQGATLGELLGADVLCKLKAQSDQMKQDEADRKERDRKEAEEMKKREQKQKESDFSYLLDNSDPNWSKYK